MHLAVLSVTLIVIILPLIGGCYNDPCVNGTCHFDLGRGVDFYECMCLVGFTGVNCDTPINYCANNPCKNDGWCTNSQTGPVCECLQGFVGKVEIMLCSY